MQPELTLNLKCPACGSLTPKTLSLIKAQKAFDCDCGYHVDLAPQSREQFEEQLQQHRNRRMTVTA